MFFVSGYSKLFRIKKKHRQKTVNTSVRININKIKNIITFRIKTEYHLELLTPKTGANVPDLEISEVALVHCNIVKNEYQEDSRVLYTFFPSKSFVQLLNISSKNFVFLKTFNSEFSYTEVWFTDRNSKPLDIEDRINITLVIG